MDRASSDALVDRVEECFEVRGFGFWALETLADGAFIGFTGLSVLSEGIPAAGGVEIGWRLVTFAWHQGYATEAARASVDLGFNEIGLPDLWSMTSVLNTPSRRVMERLGMTIDCEFEHPRVPVGHPVRPHVMYHLAARHAASELGSAVHRPDRDPCGDPYATPRATK